MHCIKCGRELVDDNDLFCLHCGIVIRAEMKAASFTPPSAPVPVPEVQTASVSSSESTVEQGSVPCSTGTGDRPLSQKESTDTVSPVLPEAIAKPIKLTLLMVSGIVLIVVILIQFLSGLLVLPYVEASMGAIAAYVISAFLGVLSVTAFMLLAVTGFSLASKMKQAGLAFSAGALLGVGALLCSIIWLALAIINYYFPMLMVDLGGSTKIDTAIVSFFTSTVYCVAYLFMLVPGVLFLLAANRAKKAFGRPILPGAIFAILFISPVILILASLLFNNVIVPATAETMDYQWLFTNSRISGFLQLLILLSFFICLTVFLFSIRKQLGIGVKGHTGAELAADSNTAAVIPPQNTK